MTAPSLSNISKEIAYDGETGQFTRVTSAGRVAAGHITGAVKPNGYVEVGFMRKSFLAHRMAWLFSTGDWPEGQIDHINGVKSDNRIANLRLATPSQQGGNTKVNTRNTSGVKGARFCRTYKRWTAQIRLDGKNKTLGYFSSKAAAISAYHAAAIAKYGEFARLS
jgi:hypothetical protein